MSQCDVQGVHVLPNRFHISLLCWMELDCACSLVTLTWCAESTLSAAQLSFIDRKQKNTEVRGLQVKLGKNFSIYKSAQHQVSEPERKCPLLSAWHCQSSVSLSPKVEIPNLPLKY